MSFFDSAQEKAQGAAEDNPDRLEQFSDEGLERGGDLADGASGDRFAEHIDQGQTAADERIGTSEAENPAAE